MMIAFAILCWIVVGIVYVTASNAQTQPDIRAMLEQVNRQVNSEILPINNASTGAYPHPEIYNRFSGAETQREARLTINHWLFKTEEERGDHYGNCRTYAATKRARLIALGVPPPALSIWIVRVRRFPDESHAVLQVAVPDNGVMRYLILDNLSPWVIDRSELERYGEYKFIYPVEL
jgi:predicted transglutaminase-like cysteine proteinase